MALENAFYTSLLTFASIGFTILISGTAARYTILNGRVQKWFFKSFVNVMGYFVLPAMILATAPFLILFAFFAGDMQFALWGFYIILLTYECLIFLPPLSLIAGLIYRAIENHFYSKFVEEEVEARHLEDFDEILRDL